MEAPWLSAQFIENAFRRSDSDDSICVINCTVKPATNKGDNYISEVYRISVEFKRNADNKEIIEKRSVIMKITPQTEGLLKDIVEQTAHFETEIKMMTTALKEMQTFMKDWKVGASCYFTQEKNPPLLMIEDLAPFGFRMACRQAGLDLEHSMLAIRGLAKFHAASVAACEKTPKYKETICTGIFNTEHPTDFVVFLTRGMKTLANVVKTWPELEPKYAQKLEKLNDTAYAKASAARLCDHSEFNVINHGDCWVNNMMFKYDHQGNVVDMILVDFQLCGYGSPAIDINYMLHTSPSDEVLLNHKDNFINEYLQVLTDTMNKIGCKTSPPSLQELKSVLKEKEIYAFVASCVILPLVLTDNSESQSIEDLMQQNESEFNIKAYVNETYKKAMLRRLPIWESMGLLDS